MYTHKATREGDSAWISIFGVYGEELAWRIAKKALRHGERLSAEVVVTADDQGQRFTYTVELEAVQLVIALRSPHRTRAHRHLSTPHLALHLAGKKPVDPRAAI